MCTVIIEVPKQPGNAVRLLAVRDEDPQRSWDPLGEWWPETFPGVSGIRDRRAGGAWLAHSPDSGHVSVILNRAPNTQSVVPAGSSPRASRGAIVLDDVSGSLLPTEILTAEFNLVSANNQGAQMTSWDGEQARTQLLAPGVHMVAHHEVNDPQTARIAEWLPRFQGLAGMPSAEWKQAWVDLLTETAECDPTDDRAIIRDNHPHGYPTLSLLVCLAEIGQGDTHLTMAKLGTPGHFQTEASTQLTEK